MPTSADPSATPQQRTTEPPSAPATGTEPQAAPGLRDRHVAHRGSDELERLAHRVVAHHGILLMDAEPLEARAVGERIADRMGTVCVHETAALLQSSNDPVEAVRTALRDAVIFERRSLSKVFAGRITRAQTHPPETEGTRMPPGRIEVELQTENDRRSLHLEGAWAWNLQATGAKIGDIVLVDPDHPLVTRTQDNDVLDGRVLEERPHRTQIPLGAIDRVHADLTRRTATEQQDGKEDDEDAILSMAARTAARILATGERPQCGPKARAETDAWVRRRLNEKHTRLVAGVLLVTDAQRLGETATQALEAAHWAQAPVHVLLAGSGTNGLDALQRRHPRAKTL